MKKIVLFTLAALAVAPAPAGAATVDVRVEGQSSTLFEGRIATTGRNVQSLSERETGAIRRCDGTNNGGGSTVVPTATASTADALAILGKGFDGDWYDQYQDYLISRLGDERSDGWRLFQNGAFSTTGGCQRLDGLTRVLWAASPGTPLAMTLSGSTVTTTPGAEVYVAGADGSQGELLGTTGGDGKLTVARPAGWYRLKARKAGTVRSNRVELCVDPCGPPPADFGIRTPPAPVFYGPSGSVIPNSPALARLLTPVRVTRPVAATSGYRRGRIAVRWRIAQEGVGLLRWTIASDDLTTRSKRFVTRARGASATSALLKLPAGRAHALRFTATDRLQRADATDFGRVLVPIDDRAKGVKRSGPWRKLKSSSAWKGTILRGRRGARMRIKLPAGRTALLVRGRSAATVRIGAKRVRVRPGRRTILGPKRRRAGTVTVSVTRGSIDLDGVAASP